MEIESREISDHEFVSHYGSRQTGKPVFWDRPRPIDRGALSVSLGRLAPADARRYVRLSGVPSSDDGVRYAKVDALRAKGFEVIHAPSPRNPDHAVIRYPSAWDDRVAGIFNECFEAPVWYEEPEGRPR